MSKKKSFVWAYFSETDDSAFVRCKIGRCSTKLKVDKAGGTSNLWKHLEGSHKNEYSQALEERKKAEGGAAASSKKLTDIYVLTSGEASTSTDCSSSQLSVATGSSSSITSSQSKITDSFPSLDKYKPSNAKQKELVYLIGEWLADGMLPFNTVSNERFRTVMESAHPKFVCPTEKYFRTVIIPDMYKRVKGAISKIVESEVTVFSASTDIWSAENKQSFVSLTVHFINNDWKRKMVVLGCQPLFERHTAEYISTALDSMLISWGLLSKLHIFVRDSGANVIAAMGKSRFESVACFLHTLDLIVSNGLFAQRAMSDMISRLTNFYWYYKRSTLVRDKFKEMQRILNLPQHVLLLGSKTRWSSFIKAMKRALEQKRAICMISEEIDLGAHQKIQRNDWELMEAAIQLLQPFEDATAFAEREASTISEVIPTLLRIRRQLSQLTVAGAGTMKDTLDDKISFYFFGQADNRHPTFKDVERSEHYAVATLLDPRFKKKWFHDALAADMAVDTLERLVYSCLSEEQQQPIQNRPPPEKRTKRTGFFAEFEDELSGPVGSAAEGARSELLTLEQLVTKANGIVAAYVTESPISTDSDPLDYWRMKKDEMPILAQLAKKYLSPPMGSVASEREFKVASEITSGDRSKLLPPNAERLLFLKYNLRAVGYNSLRLKLPLEQLAEQRTDAAMAEHSDSSVAIEESDEENSDVEQIGD